MTVVVASRLLDTAKTEAKKISTKHQTIPLNDSATVVVMMSESSKKGWMVLATFEQGGRKFDIRQKK